jgi:hypothetical protein
MYVNSLNKPIDEYVQGKNAMILPPAKLGSDFKEDQFGLPQET